MSFIIRLADAPTYKEAHPVAVPNADQLAAEIMQAANARSAGPFVAPLVVESASKELPA